MPWKLTPAPPVKPRPELSARKSPEGSADSPRYAYASRVADACALITAAVGLLVAAGWIFDFEPLKRGLPGLVTMKFNAALALVFAGAALWWRQRYLLRVPLGALVALLGALSIGEHLGGLKLGIDQLFVRDNVGSPEAAFPPGRIALSAAFCFLLFGVALMGNGKARPRPGGPAFYLC